MRRWCLGLDAVARRRSWPRAGVAEVARRRAPGAGALHARRLTRWRLRALIDSAAPALVLLPHTYQTRDFAPTLAARLRAPLITDVTGDRRRRRHDATFARPMFQGKLAADVKPVGSRAVSS